MWRRSGDGERRGSWLPELHSSGRTLGLKGRDMRITRSAFILTCVLLVAGHLAVIGQQPKYGVTVRVSKTEVLAKAKTYSWTTSQPSHIKTIDAQIVAAVDREL